MHAFDLASRTYPCVTEEEFQAHKSLRDLEHTHPEKYVP